MKQKNNYFSINEYYEDELEEFQRHEYESIENEIDELLGWINAEKMTVQAKMISEATTMHPKEREKEGRAITNLKCEEHRTGKYTDLLKFSRAKKIKTDIKMGDVCVLTIPTPKLII